MKKIIFTTLILVFGLSNLKSQSFGVSAYALGSIVKNPNQTYNYNNTSREVGHTPAFNPGFRAELNYILPGFNIPVSGFNGLGFSYFAPHSDSAVFLATMTNNFDRLTVLGTEKTSMYNIGMRFGYEIPQTFNDFLLIHFGWGMGYNHYKSQYVLPEQSPTFNYTTNDFDPETFIPRKSGSFAMEVLAGAAYEFERFSIVGQYSVSFQLGGLVSHGYRHGATVGIYYPLKKF